MGANVELKLPAPVKQTYHMGVINSAAGADFWKAVGLKTLFDASVLPPEQKQVTFAAEQVMLISQAPTLDKVKEGLLDLGSALDAVLPTSEIQDELAAQMSFVRSIASPHDVPMNRLASAIEAAKDESNEVAHALLAFPKGRTLVDVAADVRDEKARLAETLVRVDKIAKSVCESAGKPIAGATLFSQDMLGFASPGGGGGGGRGILPCFHVSEGRA